MRQPEKIAVNEEWTCWSILDLSHTEIHLPIALDAESICTQTPMLPEVGDIFAETILGGYVCKSPWENTFLENVRLNGGMKADKITALCNMWLDDFPMQHVMRYLKISSKTVLLLWILPKM